MQCILGLASAKGPHVKQFGQKILMEFGTALGHIIKWLKKYLKIGGQLIMFSISLVTEMKAKNLISVCSLQEGFDWHDC